mmetsp:Transcript_37090/g.104643  ORF Transcript_37090/g.104643 Transcript_37090/m.104643 type:complete len:351 (-) Transcript_37090:140-1192(-)
MFWLNACICAIQQSAVAARPVFLIFLQSATASKAVSSTSARPLEPRMSSPPSSIVRKVTCTYRSKVWAIPSSCPESWCSFRARLMACIARSGSSFDRWAWAMTCNAFASSFAAPTSCSMACASRAVDTASANSACMYCTLTICSIARASCFLSPLLTNSFFSSMAVSRAPAKSDFEICTSYIVCSAAALSATLADMVLTVSAALNAASGCSRLSCCWATSWSIMVSFDLSPRLRNSVHASWAVRIAFAVRPFASSAYTMAEIARDAPASSPAFLNFAKPSLAFFAAMPASFTCHDWLMSVMERCAWTTTHRAAGSSPLACSPQNFMASSPAVRASLGFPFRYVCARHTFS